MNLTTHIVTSAIYAGGIYSITSSPNLAATGFLSGVLIDVDHVIEYWYENGLDFSIKRFFSFCNSGKNSNFFIAFHSMEFICLIYLLFFALNIKLYGLIICLGLTMHLLLDYLNILVKFNYKLRSIIIFSFFYRLSRRFNRIKIDAETRNSKYKSART